MNIPTLIKKIWRKLINASKPPITIKESFGQNLVIEDSSILLDGSVCYFNPAFSRENRECIFIGKKCLLQANFYFEHENGKITIGDNVYMGSVTLISKSEISIGNNVTMELRYMTMMRIVLIGKKDNMIMKECIMII
jgi:acetyltransferase-like isoleucine patch superfamily enzyme